MGVWESEQRAGGEDLHYEEDRSWYRPWLTGCTRWNASIYLKEARVSLRSTREAEIEYMLERRSDGSACCSVAHRYRENCVEKYHHRGGECCVAVMRER